MVASNAVEKRADQHQLDTDSDTVAIDAPLIHSPSDTRQDRADFHLAAHPMGPQSVDEIQVDPTDGVRLQMPEDSEHVSLGELMQGEWLNDPQAVREPQTNANMLSLAEVVESVHQTYPLIEAAYQDAVIASGNQLAAWGNFDTKLKASSENRPLGFYETYRQAIGVDQPIYHNGGNFFAGYRIGRGVFPPWYLERQTNEGGEFKAGVNVPLLKDRRIDARRAELWRATYEQQIVQPEIQAQIIQFVRIASLVYWDWLAAGRNVEIAERALELARRRNVGLKEQVDAGAVDPPLYADSVRLINLREAKLIDSQRKLQQTAIKLSLFFRDLTGQPLLPPADRLGSFPVPQPVLPEDLDGGINVAVTTRPELAALDATLRQLNVDLAEARNEFLPTLDAQLVGSQDMGEPTSDKRDKQPFELEAGLFFDVPIQRRKAAGKVRAVRGKINQVAIKRQFTLEKIVAEVQNAHAALVAAYERVERTRRARELAEQLAEIEQIKFDDGASDLLAVALREQFAIEAANSEVSALLDYFLARADYTAAIAVDRPGLIGESLDAQLDASTPEAEALFVPEAEAILPPPAALPPVQ
ncbi:MAG: TolC family protein [Planctomycetota bacterium]